MLAINGGSCTHLSLGHITAEDVTEEAQQPQVALRMMGASIHCTILVDDGSLVADFDVHDVDLELNVQGNPLYIPGHVLPAVPLGPVVVTHCALSARLSHLTFSGASLAEGALDDLHTLIESTVNTGIPRTACLELRPEIERRATERASHMALQLESLLALPGPGPEPTAATQTVDWATYPPVRVGEELLQGRAHAIEQILRGAVPLQRKLSTAVAMEENGTQVTLRLALMRIEGLETVSLQNTTLAGSGSWLTFATAVQKLLLGADASIEIDQPSAPGILREDLSMSVLVSDALLVTRSLAMLSKPKLDALTVDQYQESTCLASCAHGAAESPRAPVAVHQFLTDGHPLLQGIVAPSAPPLEIALAQVLETAAAALTHGYEPALHALVGASVVRLLNDSVVNEGLEALPSCPASRVYNGPPDWVDASLFWGSIGLGFVGAVLCLIMGTMFQSAPRTSQIVGDDSVLYTHPVVHPSLAYFFPVGVVATIGLFLYADLSLGTVVNIVFEAGGETTVIGPAFSFSLMSCVTDSWNSGAYAIAFFAAGLSGIWPFIKLFLLLGAWFLPRSWLSLQRRGMMLEFLDQYGKLSLVDSWLAVIALCSYNIFWSGGGASVKVEAVPLEPFFVFVVATVLSLLWGHIATECHQRSLEWEDQEQFAEGANGAPESVSLYSKLGPVYRLPLLLAVCATGALIVIGALVVSFQTYASGAAADILMDEEDQTMPFSLVSLGLWLTQGNAPTVGLVTVQAIFFVFAFCVPVLLVIALLALLLVPLQPSSHQMLLKLCRMLDAWAAYDVFALAVFVSAMEFGMMANFLVYYDNLRVFCSFVRDQFQTECFRVEADLKLGFVLLAVAGFASCIVPKVVFRFCQEVLGGPRVEPFGNKLKRYREYTEESDSVCTSEVDPRPEVEEIEVSFLSTSYGGDCSEDE